MFGWLSAASTCGFARESRQAIGVQGECVRQDLQRDVAIELGVAGAIDLAHSTFADLCEQLVGAEPAARGEGQTLWII